VVGVSVHVWNAKRCFLERVSAAFFQRRRSFESQASFEVGNSRVLDDKQLDLDRRTGSRTSRIRQDIQKSVMGYSEKCDGCAGVGLYT